MISKKAIKIKSFKYKNFQKHKLIAIKIADNFMNTYLNS